MGRFPFVRQVESMDCGPACLRMIALHYGRSIPLRELRDKCFVDRQGTSLLGIATAAEAIGLKVTAGSGTFDALIEAQPFPTIVHFSQNHFVVLHGIDRRGRALVADPAHGLVKLPRAAFEKSWCRPQADGEPAGRLLCFEPTPAFHAVDRSIDEAPPAGLRQILRHLLPYRAFLLQVLAGLVVASVLQFALPFLTQAVVDKAVAWTDTTLLKILLAGQLILFVGRASSDLIRSWLLLHIGSRINIGMVSEFLARLTGLPIAYFDGKKTGDLFQSVSDHDRIQHFLASSIPTGLFALVSLLGFSLVFAWHSGALLGLFAGATLLQISWVLFFTRVRAEIDYRKYSAMSENTASLMSLFTAMPEIKINGASRRFRRKWETIQARLFKLGVRGLTIDQYQTYGATAISEVKNILVMFLTASAVIRGEMTVGVMLAVQFILGQLNQPVNDLVAFIKSRQDALLALERIQAITSRPPEENDSLVALSKSNAHGDLQLHDVSFQYGGPRSPMVLQDLQVTIPRGRVTAVVGASGSGKTTLLKMLLRYYEPTRGEITVGAMPLAQVRHSDWRRRCGVVMQDGVIFPDTVERNIAPGDEEIDGERLRQSVRIANLEPVIAALPLGFKTMIGADGIGLSGGQKQRILIARAVYKNPDIYLFDEATSALDAHNERVIMTNLMTELAGKTVIVSAHRLSTVRKADQILFLEKGRLVEDGTHESLVQSRGRYFGLVKDQLELSG